MFWQILQYHEKSFLRKLKSIVELLMFCWFFFFFFLSLWFLIFFLLWSLEICRLIYFLSILDQNTFVFRVCFLSSLIWFICCCSLGFLLCFVAFKLLEHVINFEKNFGEANLRYQMMYLRIAVTLDVTSMIWCFLWVCFQCCLTFLIFW